MIRLAALFALTPLAHAQLSLTPAGTLDITPLTHCYAGGSAYDADLGRLWITGAAVFDNTVYELDPLTGNLLSSFDAAVVPGMLGGPDALALDPGTGNLILYSCFGSGEGEAVVTPNGTLVAQWNTVSDVAAATFTGAGELWTYLYSTRTLRQQDPITGAVIQDVPLIGFTDWIGSMVWDPLSDELHGVTDENQIVSIDRNSGVILATVDLPGMPPINNPLISSFAFDGTGQRLFLNMGTVLDADTIYLFDRLGAVGSDYCSPAVPNSTGAPGVILAQGSDVAGGNPLALSMQSLPPNEFGYFLCSQAQGFIPNAGGSQGSLCLALPIGRFQAQLGNSGAGGTIAIAVDTLALPLTPPVAAQVGETWNFQGWYRDNNPNATSNFTNAVSITFQ